MADEVKSQLGPDPNRRSPVFEGLTGRNRSNVTGNAGSAGGTPDLRGMLRAAYGPGPKSDVNTTAAAKSLGVSKRTVERWLAKSTTASSISTPKAATMAKLTKAARQAATTKAGRQKAMRSMRQSAEGKRLAKHGGRVRVTGVQGVQGNTSFYVRYRSVAFPPTQAGMSPADVEALWGAYEQGGDKGASTWLTQYARENYTSGWSFDTIESISFEPN